MKKALFMMFVSCVLLIVAAGLAAAALSVSTAEVSPGVPTTINTLQCSFSVSYTGSGTLNATVSWVKNGAAWTDDVETISSIVAGTNISTTSLGNIEPSKTTKNDKWACKVNVTDGTATANKTSTEVTIINSPPTDPYVTLSPQTVYADTLLVCTATGSTDADGDTISLEYKFIGSSGTLRDWSSIGTYQCSLATCPVGTTVKCAAQARTNDANSAEKTAEKIVQNKPPQITSTPITSVYTNVEYYYDVEATDLESDTITYSLVSSPTGMIIDVNSGEIRWTPTSKGTRAITVRASDALGYSEQSYSLVVKTQEKLSIEDVEVTVDGSTDRTLADGDTISEEARPESEIKVDIELGNMYTDDEDLDIEDIKIYVIVRDIDDGDDLESDEEEISRIKPERTAKKTIEFTLPLEVEEGTYDFEIHAEGEDEDGNEQEAVMILHLEVEKKDHDVRIYKANLQPETVSCDRLAQLDLKIVNMGADTEDEVVVTVQSSQLGINKMEKFELSDSLADSDSKFSRTYSFDISDDVIAGTYQIVIKTYYDEDRLSDYKTINLKVEDCSKQKPITPTTPTEPTTPTNQSVIVIQPPPSTGQVIAGPVGAGAKKFETSTLLLIGANALLLIILIIVLARVFARGGRG